jgi:nicotinate-nucleotide adenylyltransferase
MTMPGHVAIFGGSFNPPHFGHMFAALYVLETRPVDALWLVPTFHHPFEKSLEPFAARFEMCGLVASALGARVRVSDIEATLGGASRTLRTMERLGEDFPDTRFSLVIGGDLVHEIDGWHGGAELRARADFIVVRRSGHPPAAGGTDGPALPMPGISSTEVREALGRGEDVSGWVPRSVLDYIASRGLYGFAPRARE